MKSFLDAYIAPHQLISIQIHQDAITKRIHACVMHTAGGQPVRLSQPFDKEIYRMRVVRKDQDSDWSAAFMQITFDINSHSATLCPGEENYCICAANILEGDEKLLVVFKWLSIDQIALED